MKLMTLFRDYQYRPALLSLALLSWIPTGHSQQDNLASVKPPFVHYEVTWMEFNDTLLPEDLVNQYPECRGGLYDVNKNGVAVGYYWFSGRNGVGAYQGIIADHDGSMALVAEIFSSALEPYSEWQSDAPTRINARGQIGGVLLHHSDGSTDQLLVVFDIHTTTLRVVDRLQSLKYSDIIDMNDKGDMIVYLSKDGPAEFRIYQFPYDGPPIVIANDDDLRPWGLNGSGEVVYRSNHEGMSFIQSPSGEKTFLNDDSHFRKYYIDESGNAYANARTGGWGTPQRWTLSTGWESLLLNSEALIKGVSKDASVAEILIQELGETSSRDLWVHRENYGTYPVEVLKGRNGAEDVERWSELMFQRDIWASSISQRNASADAGYICGHSNEGIKDRFFILSPIHEGDNPPINIQLSAETFTVTWPSTIQDFTLERSEDLVRWEEPPALVFNKELRSYTIPRSKSQPAAYFRLRRSE